jgi:N-acetylglucosamine-6-sulfatase
VRTSLPRVILFACVLLLAASTGVNAATTDSVVGVSSLRERDIAPHDLHARSERPNIVLILTDDQNPGSTSAMPELQRQIVRRGVSFPNALATTPTCCPARATLFTGTYPQTNSIWTNWLPYGGWELFHQLGWDDKTFGLELDQAGYYTAYIGRYMNGFALAGNRERLTGSRDYIPPGWDFWTSFGIPSDAHEGEHQGYYEYWLMSRQSPSSPVTYEFRGSEPQDYSTDVFNDQAVQVVSQAPRDQPLLLVQSVWAPHKPYIPAPAHAQAPVKVDVPKDINDVAGKPPWIEAQEPLSRASVKQVLTKQARTLLSVDEGIAAIVDALGKSGRLRNTLFIFASDNGLVQGRFRIDHKKNYPYAAPIPIIMRWDKASPRSGITPASANPGLVTLADIYPTILDAAGLPAPDGLEGRSLLSRDAGPSEVLLSAWRNRDPSYETEMPAYCGLRTLRWLYVRYSTGFEELYDVVRDPLSRRNLINDRPATTELTLLRENTRERCSPTPPNFTWSKSPQSGSRSREDVREWRVE